MKNSYAALLVVGAIAATAGIQEWRYAGLRRSVGQAADSGLQTNVIPSRAEPNFLPKESRREPVADRKGEEKSGSDGGAFNKSIRKIWDNPAGKSMMSQGVKMAIAMMYEDYIGTLDLSDEEAKHFRELLGNEMASQQEFGMKLMSATPEERESLTKEMAKLTEQNDKEIEIFLNNDEDYESFKAYKDRLPEKQQLEGLRASMAAKDAAMDEETESKLVEAMYQARIQPGSPDFSGPGAFEEMGREGMVERFEQTWETQQATLREEVGFLSEPQKEAFFDHQEQMKEFQLMGMKMAEQMMKKDE